MANPASFLRRHFLWFLLAAYGVATLVPGPGAAAARFDFCEWLGIGGRATAPMAMVSALLYLAAMAVDLGELRVLLQRPALWAAGLAGVWLGPAAVVVLGGWLVPDATEASPFAGLLLGMTLVAAMPVANSSVAWTQQSGGSLPWSLGLVVLSILLTPWTTPLLMQLLGLSLSGAEAEQVERLIVSLSSVPFIVWVVLPTAAGLATRRWVGAEGVAAMGLGRQLTASVLLLALNYAGASLALPRFFEHPSTAVLAAAALAATGMAVVGLLSASLLGVAFGLDRPTSDAMRYGLCMKHTGLALALATAAGVADQAEAMLLIVVATPTQHIVAALIDRRRAAEGHGSSGS